MARKKLIVMLWCRQIKVFAQVVIAMAHHGYLELEWGHLMVEFIVRQCSLTDDPPVSLPAVLHHDAVTCVCVGGGGMCLCVVCVCAHVMFACVCVCCLSHTFVIPGQKTSRSGFCDQPAVAQYVWQHSSPRHHHHRHHGACELALFSFLEKTSFCFSGNAKNDQTEMWKYKQHQKWLMLTLKIRNHLYVI